MTLAALDAGESPRDTDLLALDQAMQRLAGIDARRAQIVELRVFGGLDFAEIGEVMQLSRATLDREFRTARLWLFHAISVDGAAPS